MQKIFLGGTVGSNNWREAFTKLLLDSGVPNEAIFNPVVENWTPECQAVEDRVKREAAFNLFFIGNPKNANSEISAYSLVEAVMGLYDEAARTIVVFDLSDFSEHVSKAMRKIESDLRHRFPSRMIYSSLQEAAQTIAKHYQRPKDVDEVTAELLDKLRYTLRDDYLVGVCEEGGELSLIVYNTRRTIPPQQELSKIPKQFKGYSVAFKWIGVIPSHAL